MATYLEHANITVPDIDAAISFLKVIDPSFNVRCDKTVEGGIRWVHVGTERHYIALQEPHLDATPVNPVPSYKNYGVNHLSWVVDDLASVITRLEEGGYKKGIPVDPEPYRKRAYYYDLAGFEWEIVQYLSNKPDERNYYE